jgi:magnesium-transporting ATPase (P-type)
LRIIIATTFLTAAVVGSTFMVMDWGYSPAQQRATAFNTLNFGAIAVTCSARFTYNSSIHLRLFRGNNTLIYSIIIVTVLQIATTYIPGLNSVIFSMEGMDGPQWAISLIAPLIVFLVMEAEKATRRYLKAQGKDTDDLEVSGFDRKVEPPPPGSRLLPKGGSKLDVFE